MAGGADSLTVHVRGDRRHMQDADAFRIRAEVPLPLNFEMGVTAEMLDIARRLRPDFAAAKRVPPRTSSSGSRASPIRCD